MSDNQRLSVREEIVNNLGFWTADLQNMLECLCIAVAGLGGAGGAVVELLARCGVGQFKLADPDRVEVSNIGRQAGATFASVGKRKTEVMAELVRSVHRSPTIEIFDDGVTENNLGSFLHGADLVLDAIAIEAGWLSVLLGRSARDLGIPMITSIEVGDGCQYTVFDPTRLEPHSTVDAFFGVDPTEDATAELQIDVTAMLSYLPHYFPVGLMEALEQGKVRTPAHAMGVSRNASAVARSIRELLLYPDEEHPFVYPYVVIDDPDPRVGTFMLHHSQRARLLQESAAALGNGRSQRRFSTTDEYELDKYR